MSKTIDLRSDTVTQPTQGMRAAMVSAPLGDDVYGDDPSVRSLEETAAGLTGHDAAVFAPSGTQTNLLALLSHCQRGDEYLVAQEAHTYKFEGGGAAVLGSIQPQPIHQEPNGTLDLTKVATYIKPDDAHYAMTRLLALENTTNGKVLPLEYLSASREFVDQHGLQLHLDGARVANAAVASGVALSEITSHFDSVSVCLSKGLGAPVGSVLCGSRELIARARRWRKMLGGGMRQAGVIAAAGEYALKHHIDRLAEDHMRAEVLADGLRNLGIEVLSQATNMVFIESPKRSFVDDMATYGIVMGAGYGTLRLVTHLDVDDADVERILTAASAVLKA
jgi:threonine aldolase